MYNTEKCWKMAVVLAFQGGSMRFCGLPDQKTVC